MGAMMYFVIVDPKQRTVRTVVCGSLHEAQTLAGLGNVDHGVMSRGVGYVVYEYGFFTPVAEQSYCSIAGRLIAGACVLYGFDELGETVDLMASAVPDVRWYLGANDVEAAIERGEVQRPIIALNGKEEWHWPQPAPEGFSR
jgi:hypothetical protein